MAESAPPAPPPSPPAPSSPATSSAPGGASRFAALRGRATAIDIPLLVVALVMTVLTWPLDSLELAPGLDPSWRTALQMAVHDGLDFGRDVIFSYGPLGFLREPVLAFPWLSRLAFAYTAIVQFALCLTLLWALRRNLGSLLLAVPFAFLVVELLVEEPLPVIVFAVAAGLVRADIGARVAPWVLAGVGSLAAVQALAKLNVGVVVLALAAIGLLAQPAPRRRVTAAFAGGLVVTLVAGWLLAGQSVAAVRGYLHGSLDVISGYSQAMTFEAPGSAWQLWAVPVLIGIGFAIILGADRLSPRHTRAGLALLWAVLAFTAFKSGFVRHDDGHANIFFATMLGGFAVLPLARLPRATAALVLLVAVMALFGAHDGGPADYVMPREQASRFLDQTRVLAVPRTTNEHIVAGRARLVAAYALDPASFARLGDHSVHVEPYDTNAVLAYRLRWEPLPVFQSYSAYTARLDELNAGAYASPRGPERVLRHAVGALDGRNPAWESPAAMRAMLCNFRALSTTDAWQVLGRVANRCGPPRPLGASQVRYGEGVTIPPAPDRRSAVYAVVDRASFAGAERLVNLLYRAAPRTLTLEGTRPYRLVPATAIGGLLLRVPRSADFPAPFALDQGATQLAITRGTGEQRGGAIRVRWFAMAVR